MNKTTRPGIFVLLPLAILGSGCSFLSGKPTRSAQPKTEIEYAPDGSREPQLAEKKEPSAEADPSRLPSEVLAASKKATVLIGNFEGGKLSSSGTGFVVGDGKRVVTNKHVVTGSDETPDPLKLVFFSGEPSARIVEIKPDKISLYGTLERGHKDYVREDLAYITLGALVAPPLKVAPKTPIEETMPVWAFGYPGGGENLSEKDLPNPTVHALRIERIERGSAGVHLIQLSGSATGGNSGGAVINREGQVIGVLHAKFTDAPILFALPSSRVAKMLSGARSGVISIGEQWRAPIGGKKSSPVAKEDEPRAETSDDAGPRQDTGGILNIVALSEESISDASPLTLTVMRNEPFARRGYIFTRSVLRRAFASEPWYTPRTRNLNAVQRLLTKLEIRNIDFIKSYQSRYGMEY